jgi:hypothetical protein
MKNSCMSEAGRKPLSSQERERFEGYMAEIFNRLGMDLDNEPCRRTPHRWVQALVDMTDGYNGDPNIEVVFKAGSHVSAWRPDCMAGHVRLELRNVVAKYPFERSRRFPESGRILTTRDYSCLSCGGEDTQLRPGSAWIFRKRFASSDVNARR